MNNANVSRRHLASRLGRRRYVAWAVDLVSPALVAALLLGALAGAARGDDGVIAPLDLASFEAALAEPPLPAKVLASWAEVLAALRAGSAAVRLADLAVEAEKGQHGAAIGTLSPHIVGSGAARRDLISGYVCDPNTFVCVNSGSIYSLGVTLVQPLVAASDWARLHEARAAVGARGLAALDERRILTVKVAEAIANVMARMRLSRTSRAAVRLTIERAALVQQAVKVGSLSPLDRVRVDQDVPTALRGVVDIDQALARAQEELGALLGEAAPVGVRPDFALETIPRECRTGAPEARTDVEAARAFKDATDAEVDRVRRQFLPTLDLVANFSVSSVPIVDQKYQALTVGGTLSIPFWDGARYGQLRTARALTAQSSARLEAAQNNALLEQSQASRQLVDARRGLNAAQTAFRFATETERLARAAFRLGESTTLELIDAGVKLRESETVFVAKASELAIAELRSQLLSARCEW
jgi:outer membrane protein TolC